jgi:hypothetical protein
MILLHKLVRIQKSEYILEKSILFTLSSPTLLSWERREFH